MAEKKRTRELRPGECLASIAEEEGFFVDTLWEHEDNAELRRRRTSPWVLAPGDVVVIPALRLRHERVSTDARHVFRRKGVPERFRLQLRDTGGEPRKQVRFRFVFVGKVHEGETDADGWIEVPIPPGLRLAQLELGEAGWERYVIRLGDLDPAGSEQGAASRLHAAGYLPGEHASPRLLRAALLRFQSAQGLEVNGRLDEATVGALIALHGA